MVNVQFNSSTKPRQDLPPLSCRPCHLVFANAGEVQDHCLDWHGVDVNSQSQRALMQEANYHEHAVNNVVTIPQKPPTPHGYSTIEGLLFGSANRTSVCLDTGSTTTFIDKSLADSHKCQYEKVRPITAIGLAGSQVLNRLIHLPITIPAKNPDGTPSAIQITTAAYVVDGLKAGVLLGMDTMAREMAKIDLGTNALIIQNMQAPITYSKLSYTSFHATVRPPMYEILAARKAYYAERAVTAASTRTASARAVSAPAALTPAVSAPPVPPPVRPTPASKLKPGLPPHKHYQHTCRRCRQQFSSKNHLHQHLRATHALAPRYQTPPNMKA